MTLGILAVPSIALGQSSYTWNGGGSDNNWSTGGNWGGSGPSSPQAYLNFAGTTQTTSNNNFANYSPGFQIYFNSGAGAYTLTGNAINFYNYGSNTPAIENDSSNLQTVQFQVDVENSMNIIANTGNLLFSGSGIYIDNSSNLNFTANSGKTITVSDTINQTTNGISIGSSIGSSSGGGTVVFAGTNTYTGSTTINGGTLQLGNGGSTGSIVSTNTIYFNVGSASSSSSGTLAVNETGGPTIANNLTMNSSSDWANVSVASGQTATLSGAITGAGEFWTTGAGTVVITPNSGSASRSASNVISTGTLSVSDFSTSTLGSGGFYIVNGAVNYTGSSTSTTRLGNFALQSASSIIGVTNSGTNLTLTNDLGGFSGGGLTKTGSGTLTLTVPNTYNGGTTVTAGKVYVNGGVSGTSSGAGSGAVSVTGGTLAGTGNITASSLSVSSSGSLASGDAQTGTSVDGTHLTVTNTSVSVASANLTFDLGAGTTVGAGYHTFATPNTNTTYLSLSGSTVINFSGTDSISLVDLTNTTGSNGSLALRLATPYLLISAGSNADYQNLVINSGTAGHPIYSLSQNDGGATPVNGYVVGVYTGSGAVNAADSTPFSIAQYGSNGTTALTPGANGIYQAPVLYLDAGQLEVVPEPGTWALMIGGLALLVVIQRRKMNV